jgi:SAM-dependent methyltransferase
MEMTGERPDDRHSPDGLVALHRAGYRDVGRRIGSGVVLDLGCGVGFGSASLLREDRTVLGIDYDRGAASIAADRWNGSGLKVLAADGQAIPLADGSVDWVVSSHIIEHFADPTGHVDEIRRVLRPGGTALVLTPNAPSDFENPFHVHLFTPDTLRAMLSTSFDEVWIGGHDATPTVKADFAARRAQAAKVLKLDVFGLRHRMPRSWYVAAYSAGTRLFYRLQARRHSGGATAITVDDFAPTEQVDDTTLSLFAVASRPRP